MHILKQNFYWIFIFYPPYGPPKQVHPEDFFWKNHILVYKKVVLRHWCQSMICSTMKIRLSCKIWILYLQNQASYADFSFVKVVQNFHFTQFWNPEILLKFLDFWLIFCMWPLKILSNKCYIATWGQNWLLPWFLGATEFDISWEVGLRNGLRMSQLWPLLMFVQRAGKI